MMWTKTLIGSFKHSRKTIRTVYYTLSPITEVGIDAINSFCV
jgi:4'-phosphopantetheinyl transferase EntD